MKKNLKRVIMDFDVNAPKTNFELFEKVAHEYGFKVSKSESGISASKI